MPCSMLLVRQETLCWCTSQRGRRRAAAAVRCCLPPTTQLLLTAPVGTSRRTHLVSVASCLHDGQQPTWLAATGTTGAPPGQPAERDEQGCSRRTALQSLLAVLTSYLAPPMARAEVSPTAAPAGTSAAANAPTNSLAAAAPTAAGAPASFQRYASGSQGYSLLRPEAWQQTGKAGADVLFQDPQAGSTNVGVTVSPVRIAALDAFGSVEAVGERLLGAERAKESTLAVDMLRQSSRRAPSGALVYDYEYELDSTRGRKRILSTVAVAARKLYIVNGQCKCKEAGCTDSEGALAVMRQMAQSFDVQPPQ